MTPGLFFERLIMGYGNWHPTAGHFDDDHYSYMRVIMYEYVYNPSGDVRKEDEDNGMSEQDAYEWFEEEKREIIGHAIGVANPHEKPPVLGSGDRAFEQAVLSQRPGSRLLWEHGDYQVWDQGWHHANYIVIVNAAVYHKLYSDGGGARDEDEERKSWDAKVDEASAGIKDELDKLNEQILNALDNAGCRLSVSWGTWSSTTWINPNNAAESCNNDEVQGA